MNKIFKSDIPNNNFLTYLFAIYIGIIIFILNIVIISGYSVNAFINGWRDACENRISVEIPPTDMTVSNILSVKSILEKKCSDVKVLEFDNIKDILDELNFNIDIQKVNSPKILEAKILSDTDIQKLTKEIKNISANIAVYVHKDFLSPSIKIANFIYNNYILITVLIFISIILYSVLYSYQNIKMNSESIYILTLLAADKNYIFKQITLGMIRCFIISFLISIFSSVIFIFNASILDYFVYSKYLIWIFIVIFPVLIYLLILIISKVTIYYLIEKRKTFL